MIASNDGRWIQTICKQDFRIYTHLIHMTAGRGAEEWNGLVVNNMSASGGFGMPFVNKMWVYRWFQGFPGALCPHRNLPDPYRFCRYQANGNGKECKG